MTTNNPQPKDDFYNQYLPMPRSVTTFLLKFVPLLIAGVLIFGFVLPLVHDQYNKGAFAGGVSYTGYVVANPAPHLIVPRPGNTESGSDYSYYLLAATNKAGPPDNIMDFVDQWVNIEGVVAVARNQLTLLAVSKRAPVMAAEAPEGFELNLDGKSLGEFSLEGEIIDSKCYSGVMKPGQTKTHRGCAIRCIAGGVPATFISHNEQGDPLYFVLSDLEGKSVRSRILNHVGDALRITGEVVQFGDAFVLKADPKEYKVI
ncbi:MAG: hypothetical protein AAGG51_01260 [Cyanobacteria bacterium P01_G01_bin.54]